MPIRALDKDGKTYLAFDYESGFLWRQLREQRKELGLSLPCCGHEAGLRTSKLGTRHFYHLVRGDCDHPGESPEHLLLKTLVAKAVRSTEWDVQLEATGNTPDGGAWRADVLCTKQNFRIAIEIQLSRQIRDEYERRQHAYLASGVTALWLDGSKSPIYPTQTLPVFKIHMDNGEVGVSLSPGNFSDDANLIPIQEFVSGFLNEKIRWGVTQPETLITIGLLVDDTARCWKCGAPAAWPFAFRYPVGGDSFKFGKITDSITFVEFIERRREQLPQLGKIQVRRDIMVGKVQPCPVCPQCDSLLNIGPASGYFPKNAKSAKEWQIQVPAKCLMPNIHPHAQWVWDG